MVSFALEPEGVCVIMTLNSRAAAATGAEKRMLAVLEAERATLGPPIWVQL
jgi:hypothetical protein